MAETITIIHAKTSMGHQVKTMHTIAGGWTIAGLVNLYSHDKGLGLYYQGGLQRPWNHGMHLYFCYLILSGEHFVGI